MAEVSRRSFVATVASLFAFGRVSKTKAATKQTAPARAIDNRPRDSGVEFWGNGVYRVVAHKDMALGEIIFHNPNSSLAIVATCAAKKGELVDIAVSGMKLFVTTGGLRPNHRRA